jgi:hypothetical protein
MEMLFFRITEELDGALSGRQEGFIELLHQQDQGYVKGGGMAVIYEPGHQLTSLKGDGEDLVCEGLKNQASGMNWDGKVSWWSELDTLMG